MKLTENLAKIGKTPLVFLEEVNGHRIFAKVESVNPAGSIKDRTALYLIADMVDRGLLREGGEIIEATSGNTGIGLAFVARELGMTAIMVMPDNMSKERIAFIERYGGKVVLTPADLGMSGSVAKAKELAKAQKGVIPDQFNNLANRKAHFETTAPEIFGELPSAKYIVCGVGSGGTAMGIKDYILAHNIPSQVIGLEPFNSRVLRGGEFASHKIQGIGANFIPSIVDTSLLDDIIGITDEDALGGKEELKTKYNLFCGISSGAALKGGEILAKNTFDRGDIVIILPDSGDRY